LRDDIGEIRGRRQAQPELAHAGSLEHSNTLQTLFQRPDERAG
jgi:hypothetical protein